MKQKIFLFIFLLILIFFWFFNLDFFEFFKNYFNFSLEDINSLKTENNLLNKKIEELEKIEKQDKNYILAKIYVKSPFNFQSKISLTFNDSQKEEIKIGAPILVEKRFLLGKVNEILKNKIIGLTIFDESWKSSVLIKETQGKALLVGGYEPMLTFIDKNNLPKTGDLIISVDESLPYGLIIGEIGEVILNEAEVWAKATLKLPYNFNFLNEVYIYKL